MVKNNFYNDGRPIRFANIMLDAWFKRAFGNPDKPRLTLLLLQLLLPERNIQEINILPSPEHVNPFPGGKDIRVDVECISGPDGSRFIVEMQLAKQADYYDRAVYYSSFAIQQQLDKGDIRFCFPPVYHIGILNFALHPGESRVLFRYNLQEDTTHEIMTDHLNYLFLELPNGRVPDGTTDRINDFCYYLREMANLQEEPEDVHDELLRLLFNSADYRIFSPEEKTRYEKDMTTERDRLNQLDYARAEGREKGLAEGREAQQIETARRMLEKGYPAAEIAILTGLTEEQVKQLGV